MLKWVIGKLMVYEASLAAYVCGITELMQSLSLGFTEWGHWFPPRQYFVIVIARV